MMRREIEQPESMFWHVGQDAQPQITNAIRTLSGDHGASLLDYRATLHHELHVIQFGDVFQWIAIDGDDVGEAPDIKRADAILPAKQLGSVHCRRADDVERRHAPLGASVEPR